MSFYETLLFLHVLGAFAVVATVVLYGAVLAGERGGAALLPALRARLVGLGGLLFNIGGGLTLLFGVWLAIERDEYHPWDPWIVAALVLWVVAAVLGGRLGRALPASAGRAGPLYGLLTADVAAFLLLMIFKPGA